jgi:hypothetical protein
VDLLSQSITDGRLICHYENNIEAREKSLISIFEPKTFCSTQKHGILEKIMKKITEQAMIFVELPRQWMNRCFHHKIFSSIVISRKNISQLIRKKGTNLSSPPRPSPPLTLGHLLPQVNTENMEEREKEKRGFVRVL